MTTIYKLRSSAIRAAKKQFGENFAEVCQIVRESEGYGGYKIETEKVVSVDPIAITKEVEVIEQLNAIEADTKKKASKKKEIESRKPAFIPQAPVTSIVAEESTPTPNPSLPAFLIPSPPSESPVAELADVSFDLDKMAATADKAANVQAVNVDPAKPRLSTIERPTKKVWDIADKMPGAKRKDVIAACVAAGIAYGTARTQYQHWFKCKADSAATPVAVIGKDGKISFPGK